jgi:hypothetical protein
MSKNSISLNDLLQPNFKQAKRIGWQAAEQEENIASIRRVLQDRVAGLDWDQVKTDIYQQLDSLLDIPLNEVLERAWLTSTPVLQAIERQLENQSDAIVVIPLLVHKVRSKHQPKLKIHLENDEVGELALVAMYTFRLNGVLLKVQHGKIHSIVAGKCKSFASLLYQDTMLKEQKTQAFDLLQQDYSLVESSEYIPPQTDTQGVDDIVTDSRLLQVDEAVENSVKITSDLEASNVRSKSMGAAQKVFFSLIGLAIALFILSIIMFLFD